MPSDLPDCIVRPTGSTAEIRAVLQAAMLSDIPVHVGDPKCIHFAGLPGPLPVGSVEFVQAYMAAIGIQAPEPVSYPVALDQFLGRKIDLRALHQVRGDVFIKPVSTKTFNGFVWRQGLRDAEQSEHDLEQLEVIRQLDPNTLVWTSEPVRFQSEWRYYVVNGEIVHQARYDAGGLDDAPSPDLALVNEAIRTWTATSGSDCPRGYGIDFGVTDDGRTVLVEANDGWALGFYGNGMPARAYLQLLWLRWQQICDRSKG
ncbi:MAG: ATP-grasp domain-containing protein [Polaromonas sp.]|nr:ATP-grasp domain-containing protein [Polaromonas sp.]